MGVIQAGAMIATPLGMILVGPVIDAVGLRGTFAIVAGVLGVVFLSVWVNRPLRGIDRLKTPVPQAA
jgi:predicted MFS family arabinose efflux permease